MARTYPVFDAENYEWGKAWLSIDERGVDRRQRYDRLIAAYDPKTWRQLRSGAFGGPDGRPLIPKRVKYLTKYPRKIEYRERDIEIYGFEWEESFQEMIEAADGSPIRINGKRLCLPAEIGKVLLVSFRLLRCRTIDFVEEGDSFDSPSATSPPFPMSIGDNFDYYFVLKVTRITDEE